MTEPTERELEILKILWERGEATVRTVYEAMREQSGIVQNTVQAFLRTMEEKGLVEHRVVGRSFVYRPLVAQRETERGLVAGLLDRLFDGAVDQLVQSALDARPPNAEEVAKLQGLVDKLRANPGQRSKRGRP